MPEKKDEKKKKKNLKTSQRHLISPGDNSFRSIVGEIRQNIMKFAKFSSTIQFHEAFFIRHSNAIAEVLGGLREQQSEEKKLSSMSLIESISLLGIFSACRCCFGIEFFSLPSFEIKS